MCSGIQRSWRPLLRRMRRKVWSGSCLNTVEVSIIPPLAQLQYSLQPLKLINPFFDHHLFCTLWDDELASLDNVIYSEIFSAGGYNSNVSMSKPAPASSSGDTWSLGSGLGWPATSLGAGSVWGAPDSDQPNRTTPLNSFLPPDLLSEGM